MSPALLRMKILMFRPLIKVYSIILCCTCTLSLVLVFSVLNNVNLLAFNDNNSLLCASFSPALVFNVLLLLLLLCLCSVLCNSALLIV